MRTLLLATILGLLLISGRVYSSEEFFMVTEVPAKEECEVEGHKISCALLVALYHKATKTSIRGKYYSDPYKGLQL